MKVSVEEFVRRVRVAMDENRESASLLGEDDLETLTLSELIESKLEEGVRTALLRAPSYLLEGGHHFGDAIAWRENDTCGTVFLPDDFLRLLMFEMSDWEQPVYTAMSTEDSSYAIQRSRFKGLRGTPQFPVCAIAMRPEGRVLEFYSCRSCSADVRRALYIPEPHIDNDRLIDISERCLKGAIYLTASFVSQAIGAEERAATLEAMAQNALQ